MPIKSQKLIFIVYKYFQYNLASAQGNETYKLRNEIISFTLPLLMFPLKEVWNLREIKRPDDFTFLIIPTLGYLLYLPGLTIPPQAKLALKTYENSF